MAHFDPEKFRDFIKYYDNQNPKHRAAFDELYSKVDPLDSSLMTDEANWVRIYRTPVDPPSGGNLVLKVPYFSQRDNYRDASRTCFSSSCAMLTEFLKPGTLPGPQGDDIYLEQVFKRGDSTDAAVQVQTLAYFGVSSKFISTLTFSALDSQLNQGIPMPIGILHHGPSSAPTGGGHWIIVIGKEIDPKAPGGCWYIVNDPWGEIDNASGTYISTDGKGKKYSYNCLKARWTVEGDGSGWGIVAQR